MSLVIRSRLDMVSGLPATRTFAESSPAVLIDTGKRACIDRHGLWVWRSNGSAWEGCPGLGSVIAGEENLTST